MIEVSLVKKAVLNYLYKVKPIDLSLADLDCYEFFQNGHLDSFGVIGFIMFLEDEFGIQIQTEDTESLEFRTIGGVIRLIVRKHEQL